MISIIINGLKLELPENFELDLYEKSPFFNTDSGVYSFPFTLFLSQRNKEVFGLNMPGSHPATTFIALLYIDENIYHGQLWVTNFSDTTIKLSFTGQNANINSILEGKTFQNIGITDTFWENISSATLKQYMDEMYLDSLHLDLPFRFFPIYIPDLEIFENPLFEVQDLEKSGLTLTVTAEGHTFQTGQFIIFIISPWTLGSYFWEKAFEIESVSEDTFTITLDQDYYLNLELSYQVKLYDNHKKFSNLYHANVFNGFAVSECNQKTRVCPFFTIRYILEKIYNFCGYNLDPSIFLKYPALNKLVYINHFDINTSESITIKAINHMPAVDVKKFHSELLAKFNLYAIPDDAEGKIKIICFDDVLSSNQLLDVTSKSEVKYNASVDNNELKFTFNSVENPALKLWFDIFSKVKSFINDPVQTLNELPQIEQNQVRWVNSENSWYLRSATYDMFGQLLYWYWTKYDYFSDEYTEKTGNLNVNSAINPIIRYPNGHNEWLKYCFDFEAYKFRTDTIEVTTVNSGCIQLAFYSEKQLTQIDELFLTRPQGAYSVDDMSLFFEGSGGVLRKFFHKTKYWGVTNRREYSRAVYVNSFNWTDIFMIRNIKYLLNSIHKRVSQNETKVVECKIFEI